MPSAWNMFVKKIYEEGHSKNPNYSFKEALKDASKRKSEMGSSSGTMNVVAKVSKKTKMTKKSGKKSKKSKKAGKKSKTKRHHK
jgi:hypothetical protein